jgi:Fic family protein
MIAAALATGPSDEVETKVLRAWARGQAYDGPRADAFGALAETLHAIAPSPLPALPADAARRSLLPFYEAYFSNYIEGTEFTLDQAASIIFAGEIPPDRPADAHDIVGTYRLVADDGEMAATASDADSYVELLQARHAVILHGRPDMRPGRFKLRPNQAGGTLFVAPDLVEGTLRAGFETGRGLVDPFARAVYMMFVVSEVHPFADGNGRIARVMTNSELVHGGEVRIIIPTVYRNNYLAALKGATHNAGYPGLIATLRFAQEYTARIDFSRRASAERDLTRTNALRDPAEAEAAGIRLERP